MKFCIKIKIVVYLLFFFVSKSQTTNQKFDSLLIMQPEKMLGENFSRQQIIGWNLKMLKKAEKENYKKGIIWAKINLGIQYYNLAKPDTSLKYLNEAKIMANDISADNETYAKIFQEFSQVYYTLGLYDISLKYNSKGIYYGKKLQNSLFYRKFINFAYRSRAGTLQETKKDSAFYYLRKAETIFPNASIYSDLGGYYIDIDVDSAKIYLKKAEMMYNAGKNVNRYSLALLYYNYANLYLKEGKNEKAIEYLEKSLLYASNGKNRQFLLDVYNLLAETYGKVGDIDKEKKILEEYKKFNESYKDAQAESVNFTIKNLEEDIDKEENKTTKKIILYSGFLIFLIGFLFFIYFKRNKKIFENIKNHKIGEGLKKKEIEMMSLNDIDILYQSAKSRDPNFYAKFQNLHPNFIKDLLTINPNLQNSELQLLAYIYLKFETKEIADLIFLSPKTIQNRKHHIRKKLNIPSSDDIYIWLKSFNS